MGYHTWKDRLYIETVSGMFVDSLYVFHATFIHIIYRGHRNGQFFRVTALGWGLLSRFPQFRYFPKFPTLSKNILAIEHHIYI